MTLNVIYRWMDISYLYNFLNTIIKKIIIYEISFGT